MKRTHAAARRRLAVPALALSLLTMLLPLGSAGSVLADQRSNTDAPACVEGRPPESSPASTSSPTSLTTIEQAYNCIIDNYVEGDSLNNRSLLAAAFTGLTRALDRRGLDLAAATMPALSGQRHRDWDAFSDVYQDVLAQLPDSAALRRALAAASIEAMVAGLHDNHARWTPAESPATAYGLGFTVSNPSASPQVFLREVEGAPATDHRLRPGDVIESVNGYPTFVNGKPVEGVIDWLRTPSPEPVELALNRPSTGRTWTVTMTPEERAAGRGENVTATRVADDLAYVTLGGFEPGAADEILQAITDLRATDPLRGVILDLRENSGGSTAEVARLLGAFVHDTPYGYNCDENYDNCTPKYPDSTVELLGLPLAVLTSGMCHSACDSFSSAVQDLDLGTLVGTRTSGVVSGASAPYTLDDGSRMLLPFTRGLGADGEIINEIGAAPDRYVPPATAEELSAGEDRALGTAIRLLHR